MRGLTLTPGGQELPRRAVLAVAALLVAGIVAAVVLLVAGPGRDGGDAAPAARQDPGVVNGYLAATGPAVVAVSSYDYRDLRSALDKGLPLTGGAYRSAYRAAMTGSAAANTVRNQIVQTLDLRATGVGVISGAGARATVLVFGVQSIQTADGDTARPITLTATVVHSGTSYRIIGLREDANAGLPAGSTGLRQAAEAARSEITNLLSYRRKHFAADAARAEAGATGALRAQLARRSAATGAALRKGDYDLTGAVTAVAVGSVSRSAVTMLVAALGERVNADGSSATTTDGRYAVSVVRTGDGWRVGRITAFGT